MAAADFTQVEEAQHNLVVPWEKVEKGARVFCREGWVDDPCITISTVGLEEGLVLTEWAEVLEGEEGTLGEAVEIMNMSPVEEGEDLTTQEQISRTSVATKQLATAR